MNTYSLFTYLGLKKKIFDRHFSDINIYPSIGYVFILGIFYCITMLIYITQSQYATPIYLTICLYFTNKNNNINKNIFLKLCFNRSTFYMIRVTENLITTLPFCIGLLFHQEYIYIPIVILSAIILAITPRLRLTSITLPTPFGNHPFEFSLGFRRTILIYPIIYGCFIMSIIHNNLNLSIAMLVLLLLISMSFYSNNEAPFYIWVYSKTPHSIITYKVYTACKYSLLLTSPIYCILLLCYPYKTIYILLSIPIWIIYIITIIVTKYATYKFQSETGKSIIYFIALIVPPPLGILLFYHNAIKNIKNISYDNNK